MTGKNVAVYVLRKLNTLYKANAFAKDKEEVSRALNYGTIMLSFYQCRLNDLLHVPLL